MAKLFYNVSVQTYIDTENIGTNTFTPNIPPKIFQNSKVQAKPNDLTKFQHI
jgi:hypothetical protein